VAVPGPQDPGGYQQRRAHGEQPPARYHQPTRQYEQAPPAAAGYEQSPAPYQREQSPVSYHEPAQPSEHVPSSQEYQRRPYQQREESPLEYQRERDRRADRTNTAANTIHVVTALIALIFVLHVVFVLFGANQRSGIVSFVYLMAKVFVLGFGDVFTPSDAKIGLVLNYGLATIIYLVVGQLIARTLRRR
jgi:hypothetical protein